MALALLARREHGERELSQKLAARGIASDVVEKTIAALTAEGLLSDTRYTESFIRSRIERGQGPQRIRAELRERGIDAALIDACFAGVETAWQERLEEVRIKRFGPAWPDDARERSRQMRFLLQRGFTAGQITAAFRRRD